MAPLGLRSVPRLLAAVQALSLARHLDRVTEIVRHAARELTGADGATFVLRDGDRCYYVDEDAIAPLWKGHRFPMDACISGWVMLNAQCAVIEDIYADARIPAEAYRPTFVKSLAMVPIRQAAPIGAIGCYWATQYVPNDDEVWLLQALADSASIAIENVELYGHLDNRVKEKTAQIEAANRELECFSYSVSHDLRAPVRSIAGFSHLLLKQCGDALGETGIDYLRRILGATTRMGEMIEDLLNLARVTPHEMRNEHVDLSGLAADALATLAEREPGRKVETSVDSGVAAVGDSHLLRIALENLLGNAWKYTRKQPQAKIEFGATVHDGAATYFVRDNGAGFDMEQSRQLFGAFQRLHDAADFEGTGIGLSTVQRIIHRHGGRIWAEAAVGTGATFYFTLPLPEDAV